MNRSNTESIHSARTTFFLSAVRLTQGVLLVWLVSATASLAQVVSAPRELVACGKSATSIQLDWTDASTNEDGFCVERRVGSWRPFQRIAVVNRGVVRYEDGGLTQGTSYTYRVRAFYGRRFSAYSNLASSTALAGTLSVTPASITFQGVAGGVFPSSQSLVVTVPGGGTWTAFDISPWFDAGPTSGNNGASTTLTPHTEGLAAGTYTQPITFSSQGLPDLVLTVTLILTNAAPQSLPAPPSPPTPPMTAYDFSEGSGTATVDSSGAGHSGRLMNDAAWTTGKFGNGLSFDGVNDYVEVSNPDSLNFGTADFTIEAWIQRNGGHGLHGREILSKTSPTSWVSGSKEFYINGENRLAFGSYDTGEIASSATITDANWHHVAVTFQASTKQVKLYIDGVQDGAGTLNLLADGTGRVVRVGAVATSATQYFMGKLDEIRVYQRVLSRSEIHADMVREINPLSPPPPPSPPAAPGSLAANAASTSQINLSWADNSNNETGFEIDRATSATGPWTQIATTAAGVTGFADSGLNAATTYYYRARATNTAGDSANSGTANATTQQTSPTAPSGLAASAVSTSQINLSWADNSNNETGFEVDRATAASGPWTQIATTAADATSFSDSGLNVATTYYYRVRATNAAGDSNNSNTANATTQAGAAALIISPPNIIFSGEVGGPFPPPQQMTITVPGGGTWSTFDTSPWFDAMPTSGSSGGFTTLTPHTENRPAGTYTYPITVSSPGFSSVTLTITLILTNPPPPSAPSNLAASAVSASQVQLTWTDNSNNETGFQIERALSIGGPWTQIVTTAAGTTSYGDSGLLASTLYYYRIRATNAAGDSPYSNQAVASTLAGSTNPAAPNNLTAVAVSLSQIDLYWSDNANNETGFAIERATSSSGPWTQVGTMGVNATSYTDLTVGPSTTYHYRVSAFN